MVSYKMSKINLKKSLVLLALIGLSLGIIEIRSGVVKAQFEPISVCSNGGTAYLATGQLPAGDYDVYVRFGRISDNASVKIYVEKPVDPNDPYFKTDCALIGDGHATGDSWSKVGALSEVGETNLINISLQTDFYYGDTDGGAPVIVFSPKNNKICDLAAGCNVSYAGQSMQLTPRKISQSLTGMRLGLVSSIGSEKSKEVIYSVDNLPVYKKRTLADFNVNYIPNGKHTIERSVVFESGYKLNDSQLISRGDSEGFNFTIRAFAYRHMYSIVVIALTLIIMVVVTTVLSIIRFFYHRYEWQQTHVLRPEQPVEGAGPSATLGHESNLHYLWRMRKVFYIFFGIILITFMVNIFIITTFTVDGVSMSPTLPDKSQKYLVKLPKTIKDFNHTIYVPNRGDIVVVQNVDNAIFFGTPINSKVYVVKRVIGLPGEHIVVKDGHIKIYNKDNENGFEPDEAYSWMKDTPISRSFVVDVNLKAGELFIIGDNRTESIDSRSFGPVSAEQVIGRVIK